MGLIRCVAYLWSLLFSGSPSPSRNITRRQQVEANLKSAALYKKWVEEKLTDSRVCQASKEASQRASEEFDRCTEESTRAEVDCNILFEKTQLLLQSYRQCLSACEGDIRACTESGLDLELAEIALNRLRSRAPAEASGFDALLEQCRQKREKKLYEEAGKDARALVPVINLGLWRLAWKAGIDSLAEWRGAGSKDALVAECGEAQILPIAIWAPEQVESICASFGFSPTKTYLVFQAMELVAKWSPPASKWQNHVYHRTVDYAKLAVLAEVRVRFATEKFGINSPERIAALLSFSAACQQKGMFLSVPGIFATRQERQEAAEWELKQYDESWTAVLEALRAADSLWAPDDERVRRVLWTALVTTRRRDAAMPDGLKERLEELSSVIYGKSKK